MEERDRKNFSTILLVVGGLFIIVSGGIFVSKTWHYLPEVVKKLCLVAVTAGFFAGSHFLEKKSLHKAGTALYYLGICFTGFSGTALLSAMDVESEVTWLLTMLFMSVPVGLRFWRERKVIDLVIQIFLCDGMLLNLANLGEDGFGGKMALICFATFTMALAALLYYCRKPAMELSRDGRGSSEFQDVFAEEPLTVTAAIAYVLHLLVSLPLTTVMLLAEPSFFFGTFPVLMLVASVSVVWIACNKKALLRVVQSLFLTYGALAISAFVFRSHPSNVFFGAFTISLLLMIVLDRVELFAWGSIVSVLATMAQVMVFTSEAEAVRENVSCHPYGIAMAVALLVWRRFSRKEFSWKLAYRATILFALTNFNGLCSYLEASYARHYGAAFSLTFAILLLAFWIENVNGMELVGELFQSVALLIGLAAVASCPIVTTVFFDESGKVIADFDFEYLIIFLGLGIVLLGKIWYDKIVGVRFFQFLATCLLMAALVLENLAGPALPNVLFLGSVALIMLIAATLLKQKAYAILAAATLILVALYLTRELWMSIAWWVYLFAAGVGLVAFAIKKEKAEN